MYIYRPVSTMCEPEKQKGRKEKIIRHRWLTASRIGWDTNSQPILPILAQNRGLMALILPNSALINSVVFV